MKQANSGSCSGLSPYLSGRAVWALSVGTSIGWGSLVVTASTFLSQAGPAGSIGGLLIGAFLMLLMAKNYCYLINRYPDAGGVYACTKHIFGYDRAFLVSWFLSLIYIAMFWANATSLPLFARYFIGDLFRFGKLYTLFGYEVYLGEALLTLGVIALITLLCILSKRMAAHVMVLLVGVFTVGIAVCFFAAFFSEGGQSLSPAYIPDKNALSQTVRIAFLSPWAFVGFENVAHSSEEFSFRRSRLFRILIVSLVTTTLLYIFVTLLSVSAYPPEYDSWLSYIRDLDNNDGIRGLPAFYAANRYLGSFGVGVLMLSLFALILTSLIGNIRALSRLFYAVAKDEILPARFARLNRMQIPGNAMLLIAALSLVIPFVGRTAIGWVVDTTTLGSTLIYGFVSAGAMKQARQDNNRRQRVLGAIGLVVMLVFSVYLLFPSLFTEYLLETETYILFIVWSILGFLYFRRIIQKDHARRFGKAIIVWIVLLALVVFMSLVWTNRVDEGSSRDAIYSMQDFYNGAAPPEAYALGEEAFIAGLVARQHRIDTMTTIVVIGLFGLALAAMLVNHFSMRKWEAVVRNERDAARSAAYRDPLTGVKSKQAYLEREDALDTAITEGRCAPFSILVCDVNGLKHINDTLGHAAGDEYIRAASALICERFKHSPVFRVGGDEFVVLPEGQDRLRRDEILAELNRELEANIAAGGVVVSIGCADYVPQQDKLFHDVFERADNLMYLRKQELKRMGAVTRE